MISSPFYFWSDTLPNWIMALSAISAVAAFVWRHQDRREEQVLKATQIRDGVSAVWATVRLEPNGPRKWGLLVTNSLETPVFDVSVECSGNIGSNKLTLRSVQPGRYFFESLANEQHRPWGFAVSNFQDLEFITASKSHLTKQLEFTHNEETYTKALELNR